MPEIMTSRGWRWISWREDYPTLAEILEVAKREFPEIPPEHLQLDITGNTGDTIQLCNNIEMNNIEADD